MKMKRILLFGMIFILLFDFSIENKEDFESGEDFELTTENNTVALSDGDTEDLREEEDNSSVFENRLKSSVSVCSEL
jgi:hypothetical protein